MAIAFDAVTNFTYTTGGSPWTAGNHTVTGSNTIIFVICFGAGTSNITPSSVTYAGSSMTLITGVIGSVNHRSTVWYLLNPASGSNPVVITWSGGTTFMSGGAISYTGVLQTGQPDASTTNTGSGTSLTTSLSSIANNCWFLLMGANNVGANSAGTGATARTNTGISWDIFDSNGPITPAGSYSMQFLPTSTSVLDSVMVSFSPVSVTPILPSVSDSETITESISLLITTPSIVSPNVNDSDSATEATSIIITGGGHSAPIITFRQTTAPWNTLSTLNYVQTKDPLTGISFPILGGETSDYISFRIYNNFGLATNIADAISVAIMAFDDNSGSNTSLKSVIGQQWLAIQETRFGQGPSSPGPITDLFAQPLMPIGGHSDYNPPIGNDNSTSPIIRTNGGNGCGFIEFKTCLQVPTNAIAGQINFTIVVQYDWTS